MHPFPILERFVDHDVSVDGTVVVPANTQVIIFPPDFAHCSTYPAFPVFGSGKRSCVGMQLASALLGVFKDELAALPQFVPEVNHRYSGRNNDGKTNMTEMVYFAKTVLKAIVWS